MVFGARLKWMDETYKGHDPELRFSNIPLDVSWIFRLEGNREKFVLEEVLAGLFP